MSRGDASARGAWAEDQALAFLQARGLNALARNYRCRWGEIDLVMREQDTLVFVEVRFRANADYGSGADSVGRNKRRKIVATAHDYLQREAALSRCPCRFDVISVSLSRNRGDVQIEWIKHAFES